MLDMIQIDDDFFVNIVQSFTDGNCIIIQHFNSIQQFVHSLLDHVVYFLQSFQNLFLLQRLLDLFFKQSIYLLVLLQKCLQILIFFIVNISLDLPHIFVLLIDEFEIVLLKSVDNKALILQFFLQRTNIWLSIFQFILHHFFIFISFARFD